MNKKYTLITAGGAGVRMKASLPKQFMEVCGKPLILHTLSVFLRYAPDMHFVIVLPSEQMDYWQQLCEKYRFNSGMVAEGGPTRFHSVKNGLRQVPDDALVAIHDAVRPLVSLETISRGFHFAARYGNAIPVVSLNESVREVDHALSKSVDRQKYRLVQTPQVFSAKLIKEAYRVNYQESFTDDASVLESAGHRIFLVDGNRENIKITEPLDLILAEALLKQS